MENTKLWTARYFIYLFLIGNFIFFFMVYLQPHAILGPTTIVINQTYTSHKDYLVYTSKCMIPDLDPWNEEVKPFYKKEAYVSCSRYKPLIYVVKNESSAILRMDKKVTKNYSIKPITCCYINVTRNAKAGVPDDDIEFSKCLDFHGDLNITGKVVTVKCSSKKVIYSNSYAPVTITEDVQTKMSMHSNLTAWETKPPNILFIGIDSISRLNFIRTMPKTRKFLTDTEWIEYKGYNKIDDNTFPNLMAILTGKEPRAAYNVCKPTLSGGLDACNLVWRDYRDFGYVTAYAEDESSINTFNYHKKGFVQQPTDYYFRSYAVAANKLTKKLVDEMNYCTGPESSGERILNVAKDFATTFIDYPNFGFFWMNTFSHNKLNSPTRMDDKVSQFFKELQESGYLNNSIIIFLSDHGIRFGEVRKTNTGWLEERLPFLYFRFPKLFQEKYTEEYYYVRRNAENQLTTPYDLHMTLKHILKLFNPNYSVKPCEGCSICKSLLEEIHPRSCEEVGIDKHWCTCYGYKTVNITGELVKQAGKFVVNQVNKLVASYGKDSKKCAKYNLSKIISARISVETPNENETYILIIVETAPKAVLESTITVVNDIPRKGSYLSRLDRYASYSHCVQDSNLKKYCYCK